MFRRQDRNQPQEESENIFVSMTDLTISLLLVVLVILGFFAVTLGQSVKRAELEALQLEIDTLSTDNASLEGKLGEANSQLAREGEALELARSAAVALERRVVDLEAQNSSLSRQLKSSTQLRDSLEEMYASVNSQVLALSSRVEELGARLSRESERSQNLNRQLAASEGSRQVAEDQLADEIQRGDSLGVELAQLRRQADSRGREHAEALAERDQVIQDLQAQLAGARGEVARLSDTVALQDSRLEGAAQKLRAAQLGFEEALGAAYAEVEGLRGQLAAARGELDLQRELVASQRAQSQALRLSLGEREAEVEVLRGSVGEQATALTAAGDELARLRSDLGEARSELKALSNRLSEREAALVELTALRQTEARGGERRLADKVSQIEKLQSDMTRQVARAERAEANLLREREEVRRRAEALRVAAQSEARLTGELASLRSELSSRDAALKILSSEHAELVSTLKGELSELRVASERSRAAFEFERGELRSEIASLGRLQAQMDEEIKILRSQDRARVETIAGLLKSRADLRDALSQVRGALALREAEIADQLGVLEAVKSDAAVAQVLIDDLRLDLSQSQAARVELEDALSAYLAELDVLQTRNQKLDGLRIRLEAEAVRARDAHAAALAELNAELAAKSAALDAARATGRADGAARDALRSDLANARDALSFEQSQRARAQAEVETLREQLELAEATAREDLDQLNRARAELIAELARLNRSNADLQKLAEAAEEEGIGNAELLSQLAYLLEMEGQSPAFIISTVDKLKQFYLSADEEALRLRREVRNARDAASACQRQLSDATNSLGRANAEVGQCTRRASDLVNQRDEAELAVRLLEGKVRRMSEEAERQ